MDSKIRNKLIAILLSNILPLIGVLFLGWQVSEIVLVYFFETVVIGVFNIVKMAFTNTQESSFWLKTLMIPFFVAHYYLFVVIQLIFIVFLIVLPEFLGLKILEMVDFDTAKKAISQYYYQLLDIRNDSLYSYMMILVSQAYSFITDFWLGNGRNKVTIGELMFLPYNRIFTQQILIIVGGFLLVTFKTSLVFIVLWVLLKIGADIRSSAIQEEEA